MPGVFLLPAFIHLGHEYQDLLSPCDGMHVAQTRPGFILSSERVLENGVRTHVNSMGKISSIRGSEQGVRTHVNSMGKISSIRGSEQDQTHDAASCRTASPTLYQLSYSVSPLPLPPLTPVKTELGLQVVLYAKSTASVS